MRSVWLSLFLIVSSAYAQLSPGELSRYHAKLEGLNNCTQCHELGKEVSVANCLACHTAIKKRIEAGEGFHASAEVKAERCAKCHAEHFGRDFELVFWKDGQEKFDHTKTGYKLVGAHAKQKCAACHVPEFQANASVRFDSTTDAKHTFLGLSQQCINCHADEHGEQVSNDCESCHNIEKWIPAAKFSHDKSKYPLTGKHAQVECAKCHKQEPYVETITGLIADPNHPFERTIYNGLDFSTCKSCHKDPHDNKFGPNCAGCHATEDFAVAQMAKDFDHNKTNYPLVGKHTLLACNKCHTSAKMTDPIAHAKCQDCHRDEHRGQFASRADGGACESCHSLDGYIPARYGIEEHAKSKFTLNGSHLAIACTACHTQSLTEKGDKYAKFAFQDMSCRGCHVDVHKGKLDKYMQSKSCDNCHNVDSWHKITFDHTTTGFTLIGKHDQSECMACHIRQNQGTPDEQILMSPLARECELCHKDPHRGQFILDPNADIKIKCSRCHTPDAWKNLTFNHNRDARWALDGAHQKVACNLCHKPQSDADGSYSLYRPLASACTDCHAGASPSKQ